MSDNVKISIIGGDLRQLVAARMFSENGIETAVHGFDLYCGDFSAVTKCRTPADCIHGSSAVILPLPCSVDDENVNTPLHDEKIPLSEIFCHVSDEQILCGGMINFCRPNSYDYYEREELKILNAIPTAEGAIAIALDKMPITLHGAKAVILGYGRIGKALAERLKGLGCHVTVCARKDSDLALCESSSYRAVHMRLLSEVVSDANVIFNTVPAVILNESILDCVDFRTLIIDLAGKPGGIDFSAAEKCGLNVIQALSLPGKVAPETAGSIIYKTVNIILKQEGVL
ncbi:MAG: dipicolinate synthase subunit DpsA [Eubacteriales bacterium]|nr:dipicolinate synthase subunit DpsA [Eubacteriales bacterium]